MRSEFCVMEIKSGIELNSESPQPEQPSGLKPDLLPGRLPARRGTVPWRIFLKTLNFVVTGHRLAGTEILAVMYPTIGAGSTGKQDVD